MNKQKLVDLFRNPSAINAKQLDELVGIIKESPYFHPAYALLAAGRKKINPGGATKDLTMAAIYATNRVFLKKYLENAAGGIRSSSVKDAVVASPAKNPEKAISSETRKSAETGPTSEEPKKTVRPQTGERPRDQVERSKIRIKRREEVKQREIPKPVEEKKTPSADTEKIPELKRVTDLDIDKLLDDLKSEYEQLQANIESFEKAEKSLSAAEKREQKESKAQAKTASIEEKAESLDKTDPSAEAAKGAAKPIKKITKKTSDKASAAENEATSKTSVSKPARATVKSTAKKSAKTTATKASTAKSKTAAATKAKSESASAKTKATKPAKIDSASLPDDDDDDLLAGESSSSKKKEQKKLIDRFIQEEPKIAAKKSPDKDEKVQEDLSSKNQVLTDDMVTETLASIMVRQGRTEKAIEIYNKLIWKFPHKKAYFAGRIEELKEQ